MGSRSKDGPARGGARAAILDAAEHLFATRGVGATSTTAIAKEAGVANGLIYYHFAGKEQLLDSLIAERTFGPELRRLLEDKGDGAPQEILEVVGREFLNVLERRCDVARILLQEVAVSDREAAHLPSIIDGAIGEVASHLGSSLAAGTELSSAHARLVARMFLSTLLVAGLMLGPDEDEATFVTSVARAALAGGLALPPSSA